VLSYHHEQAMFWELEFACRFLGFYSLDRLKQDNGDIIDDINLALLILEKRNTMDFVMLTHFSHLPKDYFVADQSSFMEGCIFVKSTELERKERGYFGWKCIGRTTVGLKSHVQNVYPVPILESQLHLLQRSRVPYLFDSGVYEMYHGLISDHKMKHKTVWIPKQVYF